MPFDEGWKGQAVCLPNGCENSLTPDNFRGIIFITAIKYMYNRDVSVLNEILWISAWFTFKQLNENCFLGKDTFPIREQRIPTSACTAHAHADVGHRWLPNL